MINLLNYLDRFIPSAVLPQMKASGIVSTDFQLGFLAPGFVVVYMLAAPAFGYLGDRRSRTRPIAIGVALWSLATVWSGLARTYWELFASRAAVGIGEAAYATISPALLADYYPPARRGRIFAIFYMAIPVGAALGYVVGGLVSQAWGWRAAFFVAGLPGPAAGAGRTAAAGPATRRHGTDCRPAAPQHSAPRRAARRAAGAAPHAAALPAACATGILCADGTGYAAYTFAVGGLAFWMPTFLERVRAVPVSQATTGFGAIVVVTGFLGTFFGGWLGRLLPALYAAGLSVGIGYRDAAGIAAGRRLASTSASPSCLLSGAGGRGAAAVHVHRPHQLRDCQHRESGASRIRGGLEHAGDSRAWGCHLTAADRQSVGSHLVGGGACCWFRLRSGCAGCSGSQRPCAVARKAIQALSIPTCTSRR